LESIFHGFCNSGATQIAMSDRGAHPSFYYLGWECRRNGGDKMANPFTPNTIHGSWFLAGWNDMDFDERGEPLRVCVGHAKAARATT
jgi:hypothetical protein